MSDDFEAMWAALAGVGRAATGGYFRQPWTSAETELRAWFTEACASRGLRVEGDGLGNLVGWWDAAAGESGGVDDDRLLTGSHLDSVLDGGAFDGPLGVLGALAAVDRLRERGVRPRRSIGVAAFVEEEGSRFGLACLGSRLLTGATAWSRARELRDRDGVALPDALAAAGLSGEMTTSEAGSVLAGVTTFVELHVEQGRALDHLDAPVGVASGIWPHGRYRFDLAGVADHAGTTRMEDRVDPMLTYAAAVLAADQEARARGERATFGRVEVAPNGTNAVPSRVTGWLDARCETSEALTELVAGIEQRTAERARRDGTRLTVTAESVSGAVDFDPDLARRVAAGAAGGEPATGRGRTGDWPVLATQAGHDAGILSAAGVPTAMLFVRNPTGVSHSPAETASTADCLAGVDALADTLQRLAS